ncbi:MAG: RNA methyltransferase, partial [Deltaproteobacteria bacterium]|nr:RNA methyltransferase [Deltaproteobacteria bacterium]
MVTASRGTEGALAEELVELGCRGVRAASAAVEFTGTLVDAARVCLASRIGVRVLAPVADFRCPDGATLYERVRAVDWSELLSPRHTLAVSASCRESALAHEMFVAQRTKDAIVDQLRDRHGERPSVDRADPDLGLAVRVVRDRATVALDVSGTSLHLRGYRVPGAEAPLKETLAAAVVRLSGWDRQTPLVDPMCGSATLAIEADLWARRVAPGLARPRLGLERWASHDDTLRTALARLREE